MAAASVVAIVDRLRTVAQRYPREDCEWEKRPTFNAGATADALRKFSRTVGAELPAEVVEFLGVSDSSFPADRGP